MTVQTELLIDGHTVADELVVCHVPETLLGESCYKGYLMEGFNRELVQDVSGEYGAWTATSKGGTQYTVLGAGTPASEQVVVNPNTGAVYSSVQDTALYFNYKGFGRNFQWFDIGSFHKFIPGVMDSSAGDVDLCEAEEFPYGAGFCGGEISLIDAPSGGSVIVRIQKSSGETAGSADLTITTGNRSSGFTAFASRLKFQPSEHLRVTLLQTNPMPGLPAYLTIRLLRG